MPSMMPLMRQASQVVLTIKGCQNVEDATKHMSDQKVAEMAMATRAVEDGLKNAVEIEIMQEEAQV